MATSVPTRVRNPDMWVRLNVPHHHLPTGRNPRKLNSGQGWYLRSQGSGGGGFYEQNGIYVPLEYINISNPLMGGYGFCDLTDGGRTYHPGVDLNSGSSCNDDLGVQVVASAGGVIAAILPWDGYTAGEGNHLWIYYDDARCVAPAWGHFDHLNSFAPGLYEGQRVLAGQQIGTCGRTGGWDCAHAHHELAKYQPGNWWQWPYGWSRAQVEAYYYDPGVWFSQTVSKAGQGETLPVNTTPEERQAMKPYFEIYGIPVNTDTAIMQRACLSYKRDETPGPAISDEYAWGDQGYVRQNFTCRILEWHPQDNIVYFVEQNLP